MPTSYEQTALTGREAAVHPTARVNEAPRVCFEAEVS